MNIFKKLFIPSGEKQEVTAYESWVVRWESRYGEYSSSTQKEAEVFTNEEEAKAFAKQLTEAFKLIKHTSGNYVKITKS